MRKKIGLIITVFIVSVLLITAFTGCQPGEPPPPEEQHPEDPDWHPEEPMPGEPHPEDPDWHPEEPMPGEPHPEEPGFEEHPPEEPMPPEPAPEEPPPPEPAQPQPAQPQNNPPAPANQCQSNFSTDIAVTDIFAGNLPNGQVHVRITNHGPCTLNKVKDVVYCFVDKTDHSTNALSYDAKNVNVVYSMAPGVTQTFPTGIELDTNVFNYKVQCNLQPGGFTETNHNNNSFTAQIP